MIRILFHIFFLLLPAITYPQISGIINSYVKVTSIDYTCNKVTIDPTIGLNTSNFAAGDTILIIQMKGATLDQTNSSTFGNLSAINDAGNYEIAIILGTSGNDVYFKNTLLKTYTPSGLVQLVSVPQYSNITVNGTLTAKAWDGNTGGVLIFEASATVTLNANIDASGLGFRGGALNPNGGDCYTSSPLTYYYASGDVEAGGKGEGISDFASGKEAGRGKWANGGGGGNSHNTGGGGGANYGAGGRGGDKICPNGFLTPPNPYGIGGISLSYSDKIFMGGGGGAGQQNNYIGSGPPASSGGAPGGPGGGIIIIKANSFDGQGYSISSTGKLDATYSSAYGDGAGGGGAGGTILLSATNYPSTVTLNTSGSSGANVFDDSGRKPGPGGGGGGGFIGISTSSISANITALVSGGTAGALTVSPFGSNGAAAGSNGTTLTNLSINQSTTAFPTPCISLPVVLLSFEATIYSNKVKLEWTTASEKNNELFIIEKTKDLNTYSVVATVESRGSLNGATPYFTYDYNPEPGITYYRLSQKDKDGTIKYLGIRSVKYSSDKLINKIYPVPFSNTLNIILNPDTGNNAEVILYNSWGQLIFQESYNSENIELSLSAIPKGIYEVIIIRGNETEKASVIKE